MSIIQVDTLQKRDGSTFPIGKIGQVVQGSELSSEISISSTSTYSDILSASITPTLTSSKILVFHHIFRNQRNSSGNVASNITRITRNGTEIYFAGKGYGQDYNAFIQATGASAVDNWWDSGYQYLDSPSLTSSVEYKIQGKNKDGTYLRARGGLITLMEVLA